MQEVFIVAWVSILYYLTVCADRKTRSSSVSFLLFLPVQLARRVLTDICEACHKREVWPLNCRISLQLL